MASTLFSSGTVVASTWLNDVDTSTYNSLTAVAGTNTITATGPLSMLAVAVGDRFYFAPAVTNTGAVTINISGLGVQPITKYGSTNLEAGDLVAGQMALIVYDGSLFQLLNPRKFDTTQTVPAANLTGTVAIANGGTAATTASQALVNLGATGRLIGTQTFTASGTYTPTAGTTRVLVRVLGAGGAGGGCVATAAGQSSVGGGGGAGGYGEQLFTAGFLPTAPVTVGTAGAGSSGGGGGVGGTSSFLTLSATGGGGGGISIAGTNVVAAGGASGVGSGGYLNARGENGDLTGHNVAAVLFLSGRGGDSPFGSGGGKQQVTAASAAGIAGVGFGTGGGGAVAAASAGAQAGGAGTAGIVIIHEYS